MKPYFERAGITLYHGDCREVLPGLKDGAAVVVTDPPYGVALNMGWGGRHGDCEIAGDGDTAVRDAALGLCACMPCVVFGSWKIARPPDVRALLVWEKGEHTGMGDLSIPWKPNTEEIYIIGSGFLGPRTSSVLRHAAVTGCVGEVTSRHHPTEKPVSLMQALLAKCPPGVILDPFAGSGSTLVAALRMQRKAIGIELEEKYCEVAAKRIERELAQGDLFIKRPDAALASP